MSAFLQIASVETTDTPTRLATWVAREFADVWNCAYRDEDALRDALAEIGGILDELEAAGVDTSDTTPNLWRGNYWDELAEAIRDHVDEPDRYEEGLAFRLPQHRLAQLLPADDGDERSRWLALDWLIRSWAPTWLDHVAPRTGSELGRRLREAQEIDGPAAVVLVSPAIVALRRCVAALEVTADDSAATDALRSTGWEAAETVACDLIDRTIESALAMLFDSVRLVVVASGLTDFDDLRLDLRDSAADLINRM